MKKIKVFFVSLAIVLAVGIIALIAANVLANRDGMDGVGTTEVNFGLFGKIIENVSDAVGETSIEQAPETSETQWQSDSERIYYEALENGENVRLVECADDSTVTFAFAGDVLLDDRYAVMSQYRQLGNNIEKAFGASLLERMRSADVFMINNEFPFSNRGTPTQDKQYTFCADPSYVSIYDEMGVDIVSLANNHAYDYGEDALLDTFDTLEGADIPYVGAGRNIDEAMKPVYFVANGMKIAIVSATQIEKNSTPDTKQATQTNAGVLRCMDETKLLSVISQAKANSDFVILYIHWGTESVENTDWLQDKQAPDYAAAGVNMIIGDHPHCLQKIDSVGGVPVIYSLGNFWFNSKTQNTCLVEVGITKSGDAVTMGYFKFVPCRQSGCSTVELEGDIKREVLDYMRSISPNVTIDDEGYVYF